MLLATTGSLMGAPLAHIVGRVPALQAFPPIILLPLCAFYFAPAVHDRWADGRVHPVSLWAAIGLLVWAPSRATLIGPSDAAPPRRVADRVRTPPDTGWLRCRWCRTRRSGRSRGP